MDDVDDAAHLANLSELHLSEEDAALLQRLSAKFEPLDSKYLVVQRGLSTAIKIVLKPRRLFPFLVKIDVKEEILAEAEGDRLLRLRVPPLSIAPLEAVEQGQTRAAIMYRYVTGGRVKDVVDRLDTCLARPDTAIGHAALAEVLDVVLKKCHWLDGDAVVRGIELPEIIPPPTPISSDLRDLLNRYERLRSEVLCIKAPHAIIHGDLHPKNILITRHGGPVIIDFHSARQDACIYSDYARLETYIQWQVPAAVSASFGRVSTRVYSGDPLILPRSRAPIASYIHTIRSVLYRNCLSRTVGLSEREIDTGYRGFLARQLIGYSLAAGRSDDNKHRAQEEARCLLSNVS